MTDGEQVEPHPGLRSFLEHMTKIAASDLYVSVGSPPLFRVDDVTYPGRVTLGVEDVAGMAQSLMNTAQSEQFHATRELTLAFSLSGGARFRASLLWQRGVPGMVLRRVDTPIRSLIELGHPPILDTLTAERRGLVLIAGGAGSGKSTTIAAMIAHRNRSQGGHILSIEDPIEFLHAPDRCVVTQRELGADTQSYAAALRGAARQAADVIFIGEIRDAETMQAALACASDALCLSTVRASNATQAVERALALCSAASRSEAGAWLSQTLRAVIAHRLVAGAQGGRVASLEILLDTPRVKELLRRGESDGLVAALEQDADQGCSTFAGSLLELFAAGRIKKSEARSVGSELEARPVRLRETSQALDVPLRLASDPYETPAPAAAPERRSKVGPAR